MGRYFDRAWLIYARAETVVYADLTSHRARLNGLVGWRGILLGQVNWSKFLEERAELELRTSTVHRLPLRVLLASRSTRTAPPPHPSRPKRSRDRRTMSRANARTRGSATGLKPRPSILDRPSMTQLVSGGGRDAS